VDEITIQKRTSKFNFANGPYVIVLKVDYIRRSFMIFNNQESTEFSFGSNNMETSETVVKLISRALEFGKQEIEKLNTESPKQ